MFFTSFSLFCVYLILKITFPELFIKDRCKWIFGFAYFLFPSLSTAINPAILFTFSTNFRQTLPKLCSFSFLKPHSFDKEGITRSHGNTSSLKLVTFKQTSC